MNEHKKTIYTTPEETKHIASEDTVAYAAPQAAPQHISNADALWTLIQSQGEEERTKLCNMIMMQYGKGEAYRLNNELTSISNSSNLQDLGMDEISIETVDSVKQFIQQCPKDHLLYDAHIAPRKNGTLLIDWSSKSFGASVNIGLDQWSFAFIDHQNDQQLCGQASIYDSDAIESFYKLLNK